LIWIKDEGGLDVPRADTTNELLEMTKVVGISVRVDVFVIDKQCELGLIFGDYALMAHTSDFSCEAWVLIDIELCEDGMRVVDLHLGDVRTNSFTRFATFVPHFNDRHPSLSHVHDLCKGCTIWERLDHGLSWIKDKGCDVLGTHFINDGLNVQHVWFVTLPLAKFSIDKECQGWSGGRMSGDTSDIVCESFVLMGVVLSEDGVRILLLELVDLRNDFLAMFAVFVSRNNDCHLVFSHVHDLGKIGAILEVLDGFNDWLLWLNDLRLDDLRLDDLGLGNLGLDDLRLSDLRLDNLWFGDLRLDDLRLLRLGLLWSLLFLEDLRLGFL
jgi:hypothetical protein